MSATDMMIDRFLTGRRIAVAGVSRKKPGPANAIAKRLRAAGYEVFPVNPNADLVDGERCYRSLEAIGAPVDGVVIATRPAITEQLMRDCIRLGVPRVWMHCLLGTDPHIGKGMAAKTTSVSDAAVRAGRDSGIEVISGSCPMQFVPPVDPFHRCVRWFNGVAGNMA